MTSHIPVYILSFSVHLFHLNARISDLRECAFTPFCYLSSTQSIFNISLSLRQTCHIPSYSCLSSHWQHNLIHLPETAYLTYTLCVDYFLCRLFSGNQAKKNSGIANDKMLMFKTESTPLFSHLDSSHSYMQLGGCAYSWTWGTGNRVEGEGRRNKVIEVSVGD